MARITVEDCLGSVDNRFELVMLATKRARAIATGGREPRVAQENDKPTVLALREIADGKITADEIRNSGREESVEALEALEANEQA